MKGAVVKQGPGSPPGVARSKERSCGLWMLLVCLGYSSAVGGCWGAGVLVQCSGCGFLQVLVCATACL